MAVLRGDGQAGEESAKEMLHIARIGRRRAFLQFRAERADSLNVNLTAEQQAQVDEFGELALNIEAFEKTTAAIEHAKNLGRYDELKKLIPSWYDNEPANKDYTAAGKRWGVSVSERGFKREITDMAAIHKDLGDTKFLVLCGFRLEDADRHVSEAVQKTAIRKEQIGPRKLGKPIRQMPPAKRKPANKQDKLKAA